MSKRRANLLRCGGLLVALCGVAACPLHPVVAVGHVELRITKRGIFVPLPPPSLRADPVQQVQLEGTLVAEDLAEGTVVRLVDAWGMANVTIPLEIDQETFSAVFVADLTANCLDVWVESPTGERLGELRVRGEIEGENEVVVAEGCTGTAEVGDTDAAAETETE